LLIPIYVAVLIAQNANPDPKPSGPTQVTRVVRVHGDAFSIANLLGKSGTVEHQATSALRAIVLKGPAPDVDNVEHTIQELDNLGSTSGPRGVELTAVVVAGTIQSLSAAQDVPNESLSSVTRQLRSIFPYKSYQVLSTILLRATPGSSIHHSEGSMKWQQNTAEGARPALAYDLSFGALDVLPDRSIRLGDVRFDTWIPLKSVTVGKDNSTTTQTSSQRIEIRTDVDLREGQNIIVGNATLADADVCLFLVVSAKLAQ
jgi:hypothetical protein